MRPGSATLEQPASRTQEATRRSRLDALVGAHFDFIWRLLRRLGLSQTDADDAAQQVFMIATQKLDRIDNGKERTFLYGAALRVAANAQRAAGRRRTVPAANLDVVPSPGAQPDQLAELERARALLDSLLEDLAPKLRRVIVLAEIEQMQVAEIAELERIPIGTAASRLRRAREIFRTLLADRQRKNPFGGA